MRAATAVLLGLVLLGACALQDGRDSGIETDSDVERNLDVEPLIDVNETSATLGMQVVPGDYEGMVSAWYFGHAT